MPADRSKRKDYESLSPAVKRSIDHPKGHFESTLDASRSADAGSQTHGLRPVPKTIDPPGLRPRIDPFSKTPEAPVLPESVLPPNGIPNKVQKKAEKDKDLLAQDRWLVRHGHTLTYAGLFAFSVLVLFRPYEIVPGLGFLLATASYVAMATIAIYVPSQFSTEGNLTILTTEIKAILALTLIAVLTMPLAKDPGLAWLRFTDPYIKAVLIFIILVNVVRTRERLMGLIWLSFGIGVYLGYQAITMYFEGKFSIEEYRVAVEVGGMFGNPNEMALHFVMMTPLLIVLGISSKSLLMRIAYFAMVGLFIAANMVTFSRGGFLGLLASGAVLAWKLGRKHRLNVTIASIVVGGLFIIAAPGNYGLRILSIFVPGLDPVGSSDQRWELLKRSLLVTVRNPWGIGIGNFPIVGFHNLQSHNAFTQVSSELGILGLIAYVIFMVSPYRKLGAIERTLFDSDDHNWYYYLAIGLQASIIGYMVSSFFASVAYNWFIYYLIAYAVAFRRIYSIQSFLPEKAASSSALEPISSTA